MADNLTSNQNPIPGKSNPQNPPSVPAPHQTVSGPASKSASPPPAKAPEPDLGELFKLFGSRKGLLAGLIIVLLIIGLLAFYAANLKKSKLEEAKNVPGKAQEPIVLSSPIPGVTPEPLPPVKEDSKKEALRKFFTKASPVNFKEAFLTQVPAAGADAFANFSKATNSEEKKSAARGFYIMLNNPGADRSDPAFAPFISDVKVALEKEIGGPLF